MSADVDELIDVDAQKVRKTAGSQNEDSSRDPMDAVDGSSSTNAAAVGDDDFVCNATTTATVIRRRNVHHHTPNGGNAGDMQQSVITHRNQPNSTAIQAKSSKKKKQRKNSSSSNISTFSVFTAVFDNKQRLTYGAIAIGLAVSLYPFVKYHLGFVGSDTRNNKRPDALRAATGGGAKDLPAVGGMDHQHINDMIGASQHMHRHPGMHAGAADKKPGSSKANENRHGRTRGGGGGFGLGSLLGGGMGSLYSAGAIMFALYSFAKVFMRRKKKKNIDTDEEDSDDDERKHDKKKKKQNKQVRGKKRHIDEDELSGSYVAADEEQQQRDDDGRSSADLSPTSSSSTILEGDDESPLLSSTDNEQTEHDALPEADSASVARANKKSDTKDDVTDELRRLLAETQKRLELLEQQEALKNNKLR